MSILTITLNPAVDIFSVTERVTSEHKLRCESVQRDPGGGGLNVARMLTSYGTACHALYVAGGHVGVRLEQLLADRGVHATKIPIAGETRESFTVMERSSSGREFRFVLPGPRLQAVEWQACLDHVRNVDPAPQWLVASGSLPPGIPDDAYAQLAELAHQREMKIAIDISGKPLALALEAGVDLVKPNLRELRELTGRDLDSESEWLRAAAELVSKGSADIVALSAGHHGAMAVSREHCIRAAALPARVASSVGAGDCFLASFLWRLVQGDELESALRFGVAGGTAALLETGTSLADPAVVETLAPRVMLERRGSGCA